MKIILDYNRTLFNPEIDSLYQGVIELLQYLSLKNDLFLVSKKEVGREDRLNELGIRDYFKDIAFVEKKTLDVFKDFVQDDTDVLVIGDRVKDEIYLGNKLGFITIWVQQGKFSDELPESIEEKPNYIVKSILELQNIISKYEK